jgi:hypothetical protein
MTGAQTRLLFKRISLFTTASAGNNWNVKLTETYKKVRSLDSSVFHVKYGAPVSTQNFNFWKGWFERNILLQLHVKNRSTDRGMFRKLKFYYFSILRRDGMQSKKCQHGAVLERENWKISR